MTSHDNEPRPWAASSRKSWILAVSLMSAAFFFGAVVGAVVTGRFLWEKQIDALQRPRFEMPRVMGHMRDNFDLTEEQAERLETVFSDHHEKIWGIREEVRPEIEMEIESLRRQVEEILTPEQAKRWGDRFNDEKRRWLPPLYGKRHGRGRHGMGWRSWAYLPEQADADNDGRITLEEWHGASARMAEERFRRLDANGDGTLSGEEVRSRSSMRRRGFREWSAEPDRPPE